MGVPNPMWPKGGKLRPSLHHPFPVPLPRVPKLGGHLRSRLGRRRSLFFLPKLGCDTARNVVHIVQWKNRIALWLQPSAMRKELGFCCLAFPLQKGKLLKLCCKPKVHCMGRARRLQGAPLPLETAPWEWGGHGMGSPSSSQVMLD